MSSFDSLTLAFEGWFDTAACDLPVTLRQRVVQDFSPFSWENLSPEKRRSVARQWDCLHDPATEQDRQFWDDFFEHKSALKAQIAQWEVAATPTAGDLALSETRLKELRQELARMETQQRRARGDYYPERKLLNADNEAASTSQGLPVQYVAYPKAMHHLSERLLATPEELAAWVWVGPKDGGLSAHLNVNELDPPPRFHYDIGDGRGNQDYVSPLMACWFSVDEFARFIPGHRYVTGGALIERWSDRPGLKPAAFIQAKIRESRLLDMHPICGLTQGSCPEDASGPPLTTGLFRLSDVEAIEAEDLAVDWEPGGPLICALQPNSEQANRLAAQGLAHAHADANAEVSPSPAEVLSNTANTANAAEGSTTGAASEASGRVRNCVNRLTQDPIEQTDFELGSPDWRSQTARTAANVRHDQPGGNRDKQRKMRVVWASGKYSSRDVCAEQECAALDMSFSAARKALINTPDPSRC